MSEKPSRIAKKVLKEGGAIKYNNQAITGAIIVQAGSGSLNFIRKCKDCLRQLAEPLQQSVPLHISALHDIQNVLHLLSRQPMPAAVSLSRFQKRLQLWLNCLPRQPSLFCGCHPHHVPTHGRQGRSLPASAFRPQRCFPCCRSLTVRKLIERRTDMLGDMSW